MTTRTLEEQKQLDEKIARIQKQNEEILKRQKEIDEDKRLAEEQNASVKLRPSSANISRERTPALKLSKRELQEEFIDDAQEPVVYKSTRRLRGDERNRGQGDWKSSGPPPDPRSFLYDDERDAPQRDRDGKGDVKRESDRGRRRDDRDDNQRGNREYQRGNIRAGEQRSDRGRRGGRGRSSRSDEDAWRAERMQIDEARIQRQKSADGKWRREWDSEKINQEQLEDAKFDKRHFLLSLNEEPKQTSSSSQHHSRMYFPPNNSSRRFQRGGRGRGRLDPSELELPLDNFHIDVLQTSLSIPMSSGTDFNEVVCSQTILKDLDSPPSSLSSLPPHEDFKKTNDQRRSIECVGNTVKISIPNTNLSKSRQKPQRQTSEARCTVKHQTSYSSQSDDDSSRDRGSRGGRSRPSKHKNQPNNFFDPKTPTSSDSSVVKTTPKALPGENKPPLPPFRAGSTHQEAMEPKDEDDSWEDVTTSGAESMGEDLSSINSSPIKITFPYSVKINSTLQDESEGTFESNCSLKDYLNQSEVTIGSEPDPQLSKVENCIDIHQLDSTMEFKSETNLSSNSIEDISLDLSKTMPQIDISTDSFLSTDQLETNSNTNFKNKGDALENEQEQEPKQDTKYNQCHNVNEDETLPQAQIERKLHDQHENNNGKEPNIIFPLSKGETVTVTQCLETEPTVEPHSSTFNSNNLGEKSMLVLNSEEISLKQNSQYNNEKNIVCDEIDGDDSLKN